MGLETVTSFVSVHSLVKIINGYTGACIRIRRSSDDSESDIGFNDENNLDVSSLKSFLNGSTGYLTKYYDQKETYDLVNATTSSQPLIVIDENNGVQFKVSATTFISCSSYCGSLSGFTFSIIWKSPLTKPSGFQSQTNGVEFADSEHFVPNWTVYNSAAYVGSATATSDLTDEDGAYRQSVLKGNGSIVNFGEMGAKTSDDTTVTNPSFVRLKIGGIENTDMYFTEVLLSSDYTLGLDVLHSHFRLKYNFYPELERGFLIIGDSITTSGFCGLGKSWVIKLIADLNIDRMFNLCQSGSTAQNWIDKSEYVTSIISSIRAKSKAVVLFLGTNDIVVDSATASEVISRLELLSDLIKSVDPTVKVCVMTPLPRFVSGSTSTAFNTVRLDVTTGLLSSNKFDLVIDMSQSDIGAQGDQENATNYIDYTHTTEEGNIIIANYISSSIDSLLTKGEVMGVTVLGGGSAASSSSITRGKLTSDVSFAAQYDVHDLTSLSVDLKAGITYRYRVHMVATGDPWQVYLTYTGTVTAILMANPLYNTTFRPTTLTPTSGQVLGQVYSGVPQDAYMAYDIEFNITPETDGTYVMGAKFLGATVPAVIHQTYSYYELEEIG